MLRCYHALENFEILLINDKKFSTKYTKAKTRGSVKYCVNTESNQFFLLNIQLFSHQIDPYARIVNTNFVQR